MNFCDVFEDVTRYGRKLQTSEYKAIGKYPIYDQGQNQTAGYTDEETGVYSDVPVVLFGDHTRVVKYIDQPCFLGADGVKLLKSKLVDANPKYLYYAVCAVDIPDTGYNRHFKWLKEANIRIVDRQDQDKTVYVLDKVEGLITVRKQQLKKLDEFVKARFVEMFGDPKRNPCGYPVHQLSEYILYLTSGSRGWAQFCNDNGSEWFITIKNVKDCRISTDNMQAIDAPDNAEAKRTRVQEGDLLISITADLGRTGVVTKKIAEHGAYINQHLTCIRLDRTALEPLYVAYFMESAAGKEQFEAKNQNGVKAGLNFNSINTLKLLVPPLDAQREFLCFVSQIDKSKLSIQASLDQLETLKQSLMQKYFGI